MRGLHSVAWRGLKRRKARSALTGLAIALGVANVFGVFSTNTSIDRGIEQRARAFDNADAAAYPAKPEDADTALPVVARAQLARRGDVRAAGLQWGSLMLDAPASASRSLRECQRRTPADDECAIYSAGWDDVARRELLAPRLRRGRIPRTGAAEIVLSRSTAAALGVDIGDTVTSRRRNFIASRRRFEALHPQTRAIARRLPPTLRFRVTGIARDPYATEGDKCCGNVTSLEYVWGVTGSQHANQIVVYLQPSIDPAEWAVEREPDFPQLRFETVSLRADLRRFLQTLQATLAGTSVLALFIGAFLIYLTFSIGIVERTRLFGTFHAIGARRRSVAAGVLTEAAVVGTISSLTGLALGYGLAFGLARLVGRIVPVAVSIAPTVTPGGVALALGVGVVATLAGATMPAIRAARMSPVQAIRGSDASLGRPSKAWLAGLVLIAAGAGFSTTAAMGTNVATTIASLGVLTGSVLLVPPLVGFLARATRGPARRVERGLADVAVGHIARERNRSAYTLALVMLALAAILTLSATDRSLHRVADTWLDKRFGADLFLYGPELTDSLARRLEALPDVSGVTAVDFGSRVSITKPERMTQTLVVIDPNTFFEISGFPWAEGSDAQARQALRRGGSVLLPSRTAGRMQVHRGDSVELYYAGRAKTFTVAGVYTTLSEGPEVGVVGGRADAPFFRPDDRHDALYVNFTSTSPAVGRRVTAVLSPGSKRPIDLTSTSGRDIGSYYAISGAAIKANAQQDLSSYLRLFLAVILIASVVGILGMANTLAASVVMRFREIGVLQAVGASPRAVRRMILVESATLTWAAFVLSLALGALLSWMFNKGAANNVGFPIPFVFPWRTIPLLAALAAAIGILAAIVPARRAMGLTPVEALRYE